MIFVTHVACRSESELIAAIVANVKKVNAIIEGGEGTNPLNRNNSSFSCSGNTSFREIKDPEAALPSDGMQQCLKQLEEKLDFDNKKLKLLELLGCLG